MRAEDSQDGPVVDPAATLESATVDVTRRTMLELLNEPGSEIRHAVAALLAQREYRQDVLAGWQSFLR